MLDIWTGVLWLGLLVAPVYLLKSFVMVHLHALGLLLLGDDTRAIWLRFLILAPGIFLHEASHWLMAHLLLVPTGGFHLGPSERVRRGRHVQVTLGYVMVGRTDPLRGTLIGAAPFIFGTLAIVALAHFGFRQALGPTLPPTDRLSRLFSDVPSLFRVPDVWLWVYLVFSVSNSLTPSESDRRGWLELALYVAALAAVGMLVFGMPQAPPGLLAAAQRALDLLLFAFSLTLVVDVVVGLVIFGLYWLVSRWTGRGVVFRGQRR